MTHKRPKWHLIYYILAAFDLVTVTGSLWLNHEIMGIYARSVAVNQEWADRLGQLTLLGEHAQKTNAPGNDVFDSRDVDRERARRDAALATFDEQLAAVHDNLRRGAVAPHGDTLERGLAQVRLAMAEMVAEADEIFRHFATGEDDLAGRRMATMDRKYAMLTTAIGKAVQEVQGIQSRNFEQQIANAEDLRQFEIVIGLIIVVMVACVTLYGHKIAQVMRRHEEQMRLAKEEAEQASSAKSVFLASMSHEIRTPMNGVLGMVSVLLGTKLSRDQREYVQVIKDSGESLLDLLNDILDLSKIEAGRIELEQLDVSIARLLSSTAALWESRVRAKGLDFRIVRETDGVDLVRTDGGRVRQILYNLIGNAIKFTESGGIEVRVSMTAQAGNRIEIRFEVRDTGIGMSEEQLSKLFRPFAQADSSMTRKFGGSGLGLSISKQLAELLGGQIGVESKPGGGSVFWFTVVGELGDDANAVRDETDAAPASSPDGSIGKTLRVLLAEDNHVNQKVVSSLLAPLNAHVDMVGNGLEAVAAIRQRPYDLVLMDVQMPEMDGVTAARKIRALPGAAVSRVPIIALTANAMKGDRERYLEAGMNDYVSKPIDQRALFGAILRCVDNPDRDLRDKLVPIDRTAGGSAASLVRDRLELAINAKDEDGVRTRSG